MHDILATAALTQSNAEAGQVVIEEYFVGLAARQSQLSNAGLSELHRTLWFCERRSLGKLGSIWEALGGSSRQIVARLPEGQGQISPIKRGSCHRLSFPVMLALPIGDWKSPWFWSFAPDFQ